MLLSVVGHNTRFYEVSDTTQGTVTVHTIVVFVVVLNTDNNIFLNLTKKSQNL